VRLDTNAIKSLMVEGAGKVTAVNLLVVEKNTPAHVRVIAESVVGLFAIIESIVEKAIIPLSEMRSPTGSTASNGKSGNDPDPREIKIKEALELADKTSVIFGANLGPVPIGNRATLANNFTVGLREAAEGKARDGLGADADASVAAAAVAEAVRVAADALSCAEGLDFLGQSSKETNNHKDVEFAARQGRTVAKKSFCSMPVIATFEDRNSRIFFENSLRSTCGIRATMSLPQGIRKELNRFHEEVRKENPGMIIMTRTDIKTLSFVAFSKLDGAPTWSRLERSEKIPYSCV